MRTHRGVAAKKVLCSACLVSSALILLLSFDFCELASFASDPPMLKSTSSDGSSFGGTKEGDKLERSGSSCELCVHQVRDSSFQAPNHPIATRGLRARFFPSWASILDSIGDAPIWIFTRKSRRKNKEVGQGSYYSTFRKNDGDGLLLSPHHHQTTTN
ncbi:hypothetical protein NL676_017212 [Syzygium grande]|nr:hypothetical protein NL676_017212 [Syzygium grande]